MIMPNRQELLKASWNKKYSQGHYTNEQAYPFLVKAFNEQSENLPNKKVLDIGCGNGRNMRFVAKQDFECTGIDISSEAIAQLKEVLKKEKLTASVEQGDFFNLKYKDETFGCIICINVLQHNNWKGARKSFMEMSRVLLPGGVIILSVRSTKRDVPEDAEMLNDKGITFISKTGTKSGIVLHHYTLNEISELANENGLKVIDYKENIKIKEDGTNGAHWEIVLQKMQSK